MKIGHTLDYSKLLIWTKSNGSVYYLVNWFCLCALQKIFLFWKTKNYFYIW